MAILLGVHLSHPSSNGFGAAAWRTPDRGIEQGPRAARTLPSRSRRVRERLFIVRMSRTVGSRPIDDTTGCGPARGRPGQSPTAKDYRINIKL
jgi:hypothetical protein